MTKKKKTVILIASIIPVLLIIDLLICSFLYFFEPIYYNAPDLSDSKFSFDLYEKFSYDKNNEFYIKQISYNDVVSISDDERLKYIDNTIIVISNNDASYNDMATLFNSIDGEICGYIDIINLYQVSFSDYTYVELENICSDIKNNNLVKYAIIDYFEETPVSETSTFCYADDIYEYYYLDAIDAVEAWSLSSEVTDAINIGILDVPVYSGHSNLNVINSSEYSNDILDNKLVKSSSSHGTHVAGIVAASGDSKCPGICQTANIYSENAVNNSISYWTAAIVNMIVNYDTKVINISMGYNSYIPISASLGCEFSREYVYNENEYFESILSCLLNNGYDFLICVAAGNETGTSLYKTNSTAFEYGEKELLSQFDIFNLFSSKPSFCDAEYQLCLTSIDDPNVRDRIIIVGASDYSMEYLDFASAGSRVDIVAPGKDILSTGYNDEYDYMSGTSMATPFVTGSAALLLSIDDTLTGADVKNILIDTSEKVVSAHGYDYPLLNVKNAVKYVLEN